MVVFGNKFFLFAAGLALFQQFLLAFSLYFLANAGLFVGQGNIDGSVRSLFLFFSFSLAAYVVSAFSEFFATKMRNDLWRQYILWTFSTVGWDQKFNTSTNKKLTASWLVGEAPLTLAEIGGSLLSAISLYSSIILTIVVFGTSLGLEVAALLSASLVLSGAFIIFFRARISRYANESQDNRLKLNQFLPIYWDVGFHGSNKKKLRKVSTQTLSDRYYNYSSVTEKYALLEQVIANIPVVLSVSFLLIVLHVNSVNPSIVGAMVALLPRLLQFFGSIHSAGVLNSRFFYLRKKYKNLIDFSTSLEKINLSDSSGNKEIAIVNTLSGENIDMEGLLEGISKKIYSRGRITITGKNGSGKSILLKLIKNLRDDAILLSPEIYFNEYEYKVSTGESQKLRLNSIIEENQDLILLDEWDANLDGLTIKEFDEQLNELSGKSLVIEVRHRSS